MLNDDYLEHYGTPRHSGRYPWGSGDNPYQRNVNFLSATKELEKKGLSEKEISNQFGLTIRQYRARKSVAKDEKRMADASMALKLQEKGWSRNAIAKRLGYPNESSIRSLIDPVRQERSRLTMNTANVLQKEVDSKKYLDVGAGVEHYLGVSSTRLNNAIDILEQKGYKVHNVKVEQFGTGKFTTIKVLGKPDTEWADVVNNKEKIKSIEEWSNDGGSTFMRMQKPVAVDDSRIMVRYGDQGGKDKDGVIELRRGVDDISLGDSRYAQVRINVNDSHYLKGMAIYSDDMPKGVDIIFNTNKNSSTPKLDTMKPINKNDKGEVDSENPFGATVKQRMYIGKDGKEHLSAVNIVGSGDVANEEGTWGNWKKTLASQMLSKQTPDLARKQLALRYDSRKEEFDEIMSLTNPTIKKHFLEEFADSCDGSAVHLEAAALPRQASHVILPLTTIKDTEIYAPNYNNGEKVVLIRYPHGGKFEIPELTVNNKNPEGERIITKNAVDAVGINSKVAEQLSGADFDGDTVLVIPNKPGKYTIKTEKRIDDLINFDPKTQYKLPDDAPKMTDFQKRLEMGKVSNLITDMTLSGADMGEIVRAVKHSMVVIDAQKHHLDYKRSFDDNQIAALYKKYQGRSQGGASTIISRASSSVDVPTRRTYIDKDTGKKIYVDRSHDLRTFVEWDSDGNVISTKKVRRTEPSSKMMEVDDAFKLTSGGSRDKTVNQMEIIYAEHANRMKDLANLARKEAANTEPIKRSTSAMETYKNEVSSLKAKLNIAEKNAPKERRAQLIANEDFKIRKSSNPDWNGKEKSKEKYRALERARNKVGVRKKDVEVTFSNKEWEAIQAGAISSTMLSNLFRHSNKDQVKSLAMPRQTKTMTSSRISRAKSMLHAGCTIAEVADVLGVSPSTISKYVKD